MTEQDEQYQISGGRYDGLFISMKPIPDQHVVKITTDALEMNVNGVPPDPLFSDQYQSFRKKNGKLLAMD